MSAYFLTTPRLGFRCWTPEDLPLALALWGDPAVTRFIAGPLSPEAVQARLAQEIAFMHEHRVQYWPVFLLENNQHAGCAGLHPREPEQQILELGFHLLPAYWHVGLASEAASALVSYVFDVLGARCLFAGHHPENHASRRVLEKLGFRYTHDEPFPQPDGLLHHSYFLPRPVQPFA